MEELFYRKPYTKCFESRVVSCDKEKNGYGIVLADTAFYPEGGGQPCDTGTLNGKAVKEVKRRQRKIVHFTDEPLMVGETVKGKINWERRIDHMVQHTAEHIVSGLIHQRFGYDNVGFHMGEQTTLIDFNGLISREEIEKIEQQANAMIASNLPVIVSYPSKEQLVTLNYRSKKELEGQVRIVTIEGCDCCACCGTHVSHTGECNVVKIWSCNTKGNNVRLEMSAGKRALSQLHRIVQENTTISHLLSAKPWETSVAVKQMLEEIKQANQEKQQWLQKCFSLLVDSYQPVQTSLVVWQEALDGVGMRKLAHLFIEREKTKTIILLNGKGNNYRYLMMSVELPLNDIVKPWNLALHGKGGGNAEMIQGNIESDKEKIEQVIRELFF